MPATPSPYCVLSQDQRSLQTVFSRPTPFSDVLCLETSVFRRELSLNGCLQTRTVLRRLSPDVACLQTCVRRHCLSRDRCLQTILVWRHFSSEDASLKTYHVWKHSSQYSICHESLHFSAQNIFGFFKVHFVNMYRVSIRSCFCYPIHVL